MVRHHAACGIRAIQSDDPARRADLQDGATEMRLRRTVDVSHSFGRLQLLRDAYTECYEKLEIWKEAKKYGWEEDIEKKFPL